ncbi:wall-associated receptor kinase-like 3 [Gossypium australe]|uniref:Wall-associated receptor kinase-like 3 n=1 Tax=Gossypium australe TaxID=47621 RepID=A0A5B6WW57_9ROSI|nr:wall-associated receptor kinase-like 3 [Gossypium australe]
MGDLRLLFYFTLLVWPSLQEEEGKCDEKCGNVTIPFPFGIKPECYTDPSFQVICKNGEKPYISRINMEILGSFTSRDVIVNNPVTYFNCPGKGNTGSGDVDLTDSPFFFPRNNWFGSIGCGHSATVFSNRTDPIGGCLQPRCGDVTEFQGCYATVSENLTSYTAKMSPFTNESNGRNACTSAFILDVGNFGSFTFPRDINIDSTHVPATLEWKTFDPKLKVPLRKSDCTEKCGSIDILFPFGIQDGCYMNDAFRVICKGTIDGLKPFISSINLELVRVKFSDGRVIVNNSITYYNCNNHQDDRKNGVSVNLTNTPFYFSDIFNRFGSVGCGNFATIYHNQTDDPIGGCLQPSCNSNANLSTNDMCITFIPPRLDTFAASLTKKHRSYDGNRSCGSAFVFDMDSLDYDGSLTVPHTKRHVATSLQWGKPLPAPCKLKDGQKTFCNSEGHYCWSWLSRELLCVCSDGEYSSAYSVDVCEGPGKCENSKRRYCNMLCLNAPGNYCSLTCPKGYEYSDEEYRCKLIQTNSSTWAGRTRNLIIIIGCSTSIGTIFALLCIWRFFKALERRNDIKLKQKYFKRNGGLLLQQQLSRNEGNVEKIKLFASKELEKATDYYNENRILGRGGQGIVYKGMLTDGSIVAIKRSKLVEKKVLEEMKLEQFINEVIILSQINHRNVVKLLGCCLETNVPLLVYEFIPNGTLSDLIHKPNEEFPLTWEMRLRIATEIANALFYLHSAASVPIYHRDIKSSNILLDDKYRAKVSDFGISRSVAIEQTHVTTRVHGTLGYLDPEYFRSNQYTEKSDVYSFGVVLVELLTGQKPISSSQSEEQRGSLVTFFLHSMKENSLFDILDPQVMNEGPREEVIAVSWLAKRCLNINRNKRPTMKQVAMELERIRTSDETSVLQEQSDDEEDYEINDDVTDPWGISSCSTMVIIDNI